MSYPRSHNLRLNWQESIENDSDEHLVTNIAHVTNCVERYAGKADRGNHHDWMAIKSVVLREARKRGLDFSELHPG